MFPCKDRFGLDIELIWFIPFSYSVAAFLRSKEEERKKLIMEESKADKRKSLNKGKTENEETTLLGMEPFTTGPSRAAE